MSKNLLLLCLISISFIGLKSQTTDFDISKYVLPDVKYRSLDASFYLNNSNKTDYFAGPNYTNTALSLNTYLDYSLYQNTQKYQSNVYIYDNTSYSFNSSKNYYTSKTQNVNEALGIQSENLYFFAPKRFFETGINANFHAYYFNNLLDYTQDSSLENTDYQLQYNIFIPVKIGFGRIERVEDARQAYLIVKELEKVNPEMKSTDNERILRFARKISEIRNKRVLDYRLRKIYEIEELDSYLTQENMLPQKSGLVYAHLLDMWGYGATQSRLSGQTFTVGIIGGFVGFNNKNLTNQLTTNKSDSRYKSLNIELKYQNERPINIKWQHSFIAKVNMMYLNFDYYNMDQAIDTNMTIPMLAVDINHSLGFYPNTRTYMKAGYQLFYSHLRSFDDSKMDLFGNYFTTSVFANVQYYFSPQVSLNLSGAFNLISVKMDNQININSTNLGSSNIENIDSPFLINVLQRKNITSFNIGLNYTIF